MVKSKQFKTLKTIQNIDYIFDCIKFRQLYNEFSSDERRRGDKTALVKLMAERTNFSESTVRGWIRGDSGPSDVEAVHTLENILLVEAGTLLTPRTPKPDQKGSVMQDIPEFERNAARDLYHKMCDMIDGLQYMDPTLSIQYGLPTTKEGFRWLGSTAFPFEYRDKLLLSVRKVGFDLPRTLREGLTDLINEAFGENCGEDDRLYLQSDIYKEYLATNNLSDSEDVREIFSINYTRQLEERVDALFGTYMKG